MFNKEIENLKIKQAAMNNTITKTKKNSLEETNGRVQEVKEWVSKVEDRPVEITDMNRIKKKRMKRNEASLRELWDNIKSTNIHITQVPEGEERKGWRKYLKK